MSSHDERGGRGSLAFWLGAAAAGGLVLLIGYALTRGDGEPERPPLQAPAPTPAREERTARPVPGEGIVREVSIETHEAVAVDFSRLSRREPLVLDLEVAPVTPGVEVLEARVASFMTGQALEAQARVHGEQRDRVRLEIEGGWLEPGQYLVQVRTTEKTSIPLRRYVLVVR